MKKKGIMGISVHLLIIKPLFAFILALDQNPGKFMKTFPLFFSRESGLYLMIYRSLAASHTCLSPLV